MTWKNSLNVKQTYHVHNLGVGVDVGEIGGNSWSVNDIVESKMGDEGILLEKETQWLSDSSGGSEQSNL